MITVNNQPGATVNIFGDTTTPPQTRRWYKRWKLFGCYFYISNTRLKKRFDSRPLSEKGRADMRDIKNQIYNRQHHRCPLCQQEFPYKQMEAHHLLPWSRFPELRMKKGNMQMFCTKCHKEIHCNPFLNIRLMQQAADRFGITLKDHFDHADTAAE